MSAMTLVEAIEASRRLLDYEPDWDDEGSPPPSPAAWERATTFLCQQDKGLAAFDVPIPPPNILPGPDGSIDLHWKTDQVECLANVAADPEEPISFYLDHGDGHKEHLKGRAGDESVLWYGVFRALAPDEGDA